LLQYPKNATSRATQRGKQPAFAGTPQNGGVLGAAPLGEGEAEKPAVSVSERGLWSEGETSPLVLGNFIMMRSRI
jgi:hypothetical protein